MSTQRASTLHNAAASTATATGPPPLAQKSYFEQQRELLIGEIAQSLEHVLHNMNRLNRSLEEVVQVGNEFSPVEALWSQFENVMARDSAEGGVGGSGRQEGGKGEGDGDADGEEDGETEVDAGK
ncbi:DASH complex subunit Dad1-domain-containing protein [Massariosphaeria phaeospora]|uniref:DASH complex subunit DAD1 n=1 Tax=Massariosphaeria phaeospora TaxID=100035 RepID=A0A7C8IC02_9PLEO|nr:DASH complex subunit Dad1-domain-containing protein [Massariosphaeria phaeospora]